MASPTPRASITCCHVSLSHFFLLLCNHVLTPVHPSVFILYNCMVLRLSCLLSQSPHHRNQSPVHLPKHAGCISPACLSVCALPPSRFRTYLRSLFFFLNYWSFVVLVCTNSVCTMRVDNWKPAFWLEPVWCEVLKSHVKLRSDLKRTSAFGCLSPLTCVHILKSDSQTVFYNQAEL